MKHDQKKSIPRTGPRNERPPGRCSIASLPSSHCCTIIESIGEGVFTIDLEKTITYFNPAAERITGFTAPEAVGQKCFDIFRADICEKGCTLDWSLKSGKPEVHPRVTLISKSVSEVP